jgi:manganese/zinc/iron transport system ATP- binding protein
VHHDLTTVRRYFDWMVMMNVRIIGQGPVEKVFTAENLRAAYGGQLALIEGGAVSPAPGEAGPPAGPPP